MNDYVPAKSFMVTGQKARGIRMAEIHEDEEDSETNPLVNVDECASPSLVPRNLI